MVSRLGLDPEALACLVSTWCQQLEACWKFESRKGLPWKPLMNRGELGGVSDGFRKVRVMKHGDIRSHTIPQNLLITNEACGLVLLGVVP